MAKPTDEYLWAESADPDDISNPDVERPGGFKFGQDFVGAQFNYLARAFGRWIGWLERQVTRDFDTPAEAFDALEDWEHGYAIHKGAEAPGVQMTTGRTALNLGATASAESSAFDGRYFWVRDTSSGLAVKQLDVLDGTTEGTYAPGWSAGTIERIGCNGAYLVIAGVDSTASVRKATIIDLSDDSVVATVALTTSDAGGAVQHIRVSHTHAFVARTSDATDTHDLTRIALTDGAASNHTLLTFSSTDSPAGFEVDDDFIYVGDFLNDEVFVYEHDGATLVTTLTPSTAGYNVQGLALSRGRVFVMYETSTGSAPMVLAAFTPYGDSLGEYEVDDTLTDFMLGVDEQFVYAAIGDAGGSTITIHALDVRDFRLSWIAPMAGIVGSDYGRMWSTGLRLWADTSTGGNPQVRRFASSRRFAHLLKIPAGTRGQVRGMRMTEVPR